MANLSSTLLSDLGIDNIADFLIQATSYADFAEAHLRNPDEHSIPLVLEPGQRQAMNALQFGYDIDATPSNYINEKPPKGVVMIWPRQCLHEDTLIQLTDGSLKPIKNIKDDHVISYKNGFHFSPSTDAIDNDKIRCVKITTKNGRTLTCTPNHPLLVSMSNLLKPRYIEVQYLKTGFKLAMVRQLPEMGHKILSDDEIAFLAYMITEGCLTGNTPYFTNHTSEIEEDWKRIVKNYHQHILHGKKRHQYNCKNKKLQQLLKDVDLHKKYSANKFVPKIIFKSTTDQIALFLSKMIDCDGNVHIKKKDSKSASIHYTSKSKQLIDDLSYLFTRIGMYGYIYSYKTDNKKYWRIKFTSSQSIVNAKKYLKLTPYKQKILDKSIETNLSTSDIYPYLWKILQLKKEYKLTEEKLIQKGFRIDRRNKGITLSKLQLLEKIFPELNVDKNIYWDEIKSIETIESQQTYGIKVYSEHTHITNGFITHNTGKTVGVKIFIVVAMILEPGVNIGYMAQKEEFVKKQIRDIKLIFRNSGLNHLIESSLSMEIVLKNGSRITGFPNSEDAIRGYPLNYLILDEAATLDDKVIEAGAIPTTRKAGKRWVMLSTPKGYRGALVKYYNQGLKTRLIICRSCLTEFTMAHFQNVKWDPMYIPPGLPPCPECGYHAEDISDDTGIDKIYIGQTYFYGMGDYTVISVDPFKCSFYPKEEILEELRKGDWNATLRQELLGEIIPEGLGMFKRDWIDKAKKPQIKNIFDAKPNILYYVGIDFGKSHDNSVVVVGHEDRVTHQAIVDYIKVIESRYHGRDWEDIKNDIIEVIMHFNPTVIIPDSTGVGDPVVEMMEKDLNRMGWYGKIYCNKTNKLGFHFDVRSKPDLIENLQQYFARGKIDLPATTEPWMEFLTNELISFTYEMTSTNYIKYGVQSEHDDSVIALALFVWGLRNKPWLGVASAFTMPRGGM